MENLNETNHESIVQDTFYSDGKRGNKLKELFKGSPFIEVHKVIAESFIYNARIGVLPFMENNNINFSKAGVYNINRSLLKKIYNRMNEIDARYLLFTFVEMDKSNYSLELETQLETNKIVYMVASLQNKDNVTIGENNYVILNVKDVSLEDLRIFNDDLKIIKDLYEDRCLKKLNTYFSKNGKNTFAVDYHIRDLEDMLNDVCESYTVFLCEISDVMRIIDEGNLRSELEMDVYRKYFEFRTKQLTLMFASDNEYYDMGGLRP